MTVDELDPGKGDAVEIARLARLRREKHDDLCLGQFRLEQCLGWAETGWQAAAGEAFLRTGGELVAEFATLQDAIEQHGVVLEGYGAEVCDIGAVQGLLERRRAEIEEALRRSSETLLVIEAEAAALGASSASGDDEHRAHEREVLLRGEEAARGELAQLGRQWAELVARREAADGACLAGLFGAAALSGYSATADAARDVTTADQALRLLDGLSVVDVALLFEENPLLSDVVREAPPELVREWWDSMARLRPLDGAGLSAAQESLVLGVPWLIGNLDGVPPLARVTANAVTAARQVVENERLIDLLGQRPVDDARGREAIADLERENVYLRGATAVPPTVQLYTYDRAADRIVEMIGEWAGAPERVYTYVPGTFTQMNDFYADEDAVQDFARRVVTDDGLDSVAFVYKDGRFPGGGEDVFPARQKNFVVGMLEANCPDTARDSGARLASFQEGLAAAGAVPGAEAPRTVAIGHSWGTANVLASEVAGARYDHVIALAGAGALQEWAGAEGTEYDSFRYDDALGVAQTTGLVYRHHNPQYLEEFQQFEYESDADRALRWDSPGTERVDALLTNHSLVASDHLDNRQVFADLFKELRTVDGL
ncbi:hypothetical protein [Frigoribacterium faeni]|uniref:hypothetical protein n=1 Tax=Frigoribacterium faeni TaxID=145483 RepID=UPI00141AF654|nr:hypothetical protein [Frigoribacterium faeni]NIJ04790.1 hypothetical protein [Frigoribacterium faeni]